MITKQPGTLERNQYLRDISTVSGASFYPYYVDIGVDPQALFYSAYPTLHNSEILFATVDGRQDMSDRLTALIPLVSTAS